MIAKPYEKLFMVNQNMPFRAGGILELEPSHWFHYFGKVFLFCSTFQCSPL